MSLESLACRTPEGTEHNRLGAVALAVPLLFAGLLSAHVVRAEDVRVAATAPAAAPPPPTAAPQQPATPALTTPVRVAAPAPEGQWVFTQQYGWVYMPYAQSYTYVPAVGDPLVYVYYGSAGWRWVRAPWLIGTGPSPYWGPMGYVRFAWYARPWFARRIVYRPGSYARVYVRR
jgi:hypothetical protein